MESLITYERAFEAIEAAVLSNPNETNPRHNAMCVYTDPVDATRHCIAGQALADLGLGWFLPDPGVPAPDASDLLKAINENLSHDAFTSEAIDLVNTAQEIFDTQDVGVPRSWERAFNLLVEKEIKEGRLSTGKWIFHVT